MTNRQFKVLIEQDNFLYNHNLTWQYLDIMKTLEAKSGYRDYFPHKIFYYLQFTQKNTIIRKNLHNCEGEIRKLCRVGESHDA